MIGVLAATVLGLLWYFFRQKNFYQCYLLSTSFLFWWTIGSGMTAFLLRRFLPGKMDRICEIFCLSKISQRILLRRETSFSFFVLFSIGAAYLLHSSLGGLEGLRYWDDLRLVSGISMYCVIVFMDYFDFQKK